MDDIYLNNTLLAPTSVNQKEPFYVGCYNITKQSLHLHNSIEIIYVLEGSLEYQLSFYKNTLKKGDMVIINPTEVHSFYSISENASENLVMMIEIDTNFYGLNEYLFYQRPFYYRDLASKAAAVAKLYMADIYQLYIQDKNESQKELLNKMNELTDFIKINFQSHFYVLSSNSICSFKGQDLHLKRLGSIRYYLKMHFEEKITLEDIAAFLRINKYYLSHLISEGFQASFPELLNHTRSDRAMVLLLGTDYTLEYICSKTGFSSYNCFVSYFKKYTDLSPKEFRKKYRKYTCTKEPFVCAKINDQKKILRILKSANQTYPGDIDQRNVKERKEGLLYRSFPIEIEKNETAIFFLNGLDITANFYLQIFKKFRDCNNDNLFILEYDISEHAPNLYSANIKELVQNIKSFLCSDIIPNLSLKSDNVSESLALSTHVKPGDTLLFVVNGIYSLSVSGELL